MNLLRDQRLFCLLECQLLFLIFFLNLPLIWGLEWNFDSGFLDNNFIQGKLSEVDIRLKRTLEMHHGGKFKGFWSYFISFIDVQNFNFAYNLFHHKKSIKNRVLGWSI